MSESEEEERQGKPAVRLRQPERRQMAMVVQCPDDLVAADASGAHGDGGGGELGPGALLRADQGARRGGGAGRDRSASCWWRCGCTPAIRGIGSARELARRCEESAAFRWLCGGVTVNHRLLSDFRTDHGEALDELFTQVIASLVDKDVVQVSRISQDGVRVRVSAGASSFRREERLQELLAEAPSSMWRSCGGKWTRRSMRR